MPGNKSRRNRAKYSNQSKRQGGAGQAGVVARQPAVAQTYQPAPVSAASASSRVSPAHPARGAAQTAKPTSGRDHFVVPELRTIGILIAIMLVLLVALSRIFA